MKRRYAVLLAGLTACRIGGPTADPGEYVAFPDAARNRKVTSVPPPAGDGGPSTPPPLDASTNEIDSGDLDSSLGPSLDAGLDALTEADVPCSSMVTVAVCDPVHNTGCNALEQCDVNPLQTSMPTGQCVFPGGGVEGGICTATFVNESCPPQSTCVDSGCRQLCFCNADCPASQCCSDGSGLPGFDLCGPCVP